MRRKIVFFIHCFIVSIFITSGCSYSSTYFATDNKQKGPVRFAIFVVEKSDTLSAEKGSIEKLKLTKTPLITEENIVTYDWNSHKLILGEGMTEEISKYVGDSFVVVVNGTRMYSGAFWSRTSPAIVKFPVILTDSNSLEIKNGYPISTPGGDKDKINDTRIYNALKDAGKLSE